MSRTSTYLLMGAALSFALCWTLPGHYWPWFSFQQELAATLGALLLGFWLLLCAEDIQWPRLALACLAAAVFPWAQWQFGLVRFFSDALLASLFLAGLGLCIVAGATAVSRGHERALAVVLGALTLGAALSVGMALAQWQGIHVNHFFDTAHRGARTWANLGQPNHLASAIAIGVCAVLLAYCKRVTSGAFTMVALVWFGLGLITTMSRTGYAFVAMLAVGMLVLRRRAQLPLSTAHIIVGAALFFASAQFWPLLNMALDMGQPPGLSERIATGAHRWVHWQVILDAIGQRPWIGYGWTQVALAQHAAVAAYPATGEVLGSSHNIVLDLLVWNGIPLGMAIVGLATWWYLRQIAACTDVDRFFALAIVCALTLHAMVELPLQYAYFLIPFGLAVGYLSGTEEPIRWMSGRSASAAFIAMLGAMAIMTAWIAAEYVHVESTSRTLRFVSMGIGLDKVSKAPEPQVVLLDRPRNLHRFMLTPARSDPDPAYMEWIRFMANRHATPSATLRYALAAGLNGRPEEAAAALLRGCKIFKDPVCDQSRTAWTQMQAYHPALAGIGYPASEAVR
jgi:O-antigen ligase